MSDLFLNGTSAHERSETDVANTIQYYRISVTDSWLLHQFMDSMLIAIVIGSHK